MENEHFSLATLPVDFNFEVNFTDSIFDPKNPTFKNALCRLEPSKQHNLLVYIDSGVIEAQPAIPQTVKDYIEHYSAHLKLLSEPQVILGGENGKNSESVLQIHQHMLSAGLDRHAFSVVIGGGAVLDTVGYAAATFHRGVRLVRLPTTVLAQNDSGIGVKNGINAFGIKNLLGCFAPPFAVLVDRNFLLTLPKRDRIAGIAEAVKVALIRDKAFFEWIEDNAHDFNDPCGQAMQQLIERGAVLHLNQITKGGDPFESGNARPLDYGHWSAHKLESITQYEIKHGEAVAIGMALDAIYARKIGLLSNDKVDRIIGLLQKLGFAIWHESLTAQNRDGQLAVLAGLEDFRQHLGGELCITLLADIGSGQEFNTMDSRAIEEAISELGSLHSSYQIEGQVACS